MRLFSSSSNAAQEAAKPDRNDLSRRPRIKPFYQVIPINLDKVILRTGVWSGSSFILSDRKNSGMLSRLMQMLDGQHTLEEIIRSVQPVSEDEVLAVLDTLVGGSLVEDVLPGPEYVPVGDEGYQPSHAFLAAVARQSTAITVGRLQAATVALLGCGAIGTRVALQLVQAGIGRIICLDDTLLQSTDLFLTPYLSSQAVDEPRADVLATWLLDINRGTKVEAISVGDNPEDVWAEIMPDCTLAIVAQDTLTPLFCQQFNAVALQHKAPWLSVALDGLDGLVGPLFVPHQTACYVCYEMRLESNLLHYEAYQMGKQAAAQLASDYNQPFIGLPGFADVVAGFAATECVRLIATEYTFTAGSIMRINFQGGSVEINEVLKLPRCPACGRLSRRRPSQQAFHTFERVISELGI
jgi:thiazole/oxazole-forming peptide maturase SagC family component